MCLGICGTDAYLHCFPEAVSIKLWGQAEEVQHNGLQFAFELSFQILLQVLAVHGLEG